MRRWTSLERVELSTSAASATAASARSRWPRRAPRTTSARRHTASAPSRSPRAASRCRSPTSDRLRQVGKRRRRGLRRAHLRARATTSTTPSRSAPDVGRPLLAVRRHRLPRQEPSTSRSHHARRRRRGCESSPTGHSTACRRSRAATCMLERRGQPAGHARRGPAADAGGSTSRSPPTGEPLGAGDPRARERAYAEQANERRDELREELERERIAKRTGNIASPVARARWASSRSSSIFAASGARSRRPRPRTSASTGANPRRTRPRCARRSARSARSTTTRSRHAGRPRAARAASRSPRSAPTGSSARTRSTTASRDDRATTSRSPSTSQGAAAPVPGRRARSRRSELVDEAKADRSRLGRVDGRRSRARSSDDFTPRLRRQSTRSSGCCTCSPSSCVGRRWACLASSAVGALGAGSPVVRRGAARAAVAAAAPAHQVGRAQARRGRRLTQLPRGLLPPPDESHVGRPRPVRALPRVRGRARRRRRADRRACASASRSWPSRTAASPPGTSACTRRRDSAAVGSTASARSGRSPASSRAPPRPRSRRRRARPAAAAASPAAAGAAAGAGVAAGLVDRWTTRHRRGLRSRAPTCWVGATHGRATRRGRALRRGRIDGPVRRPRLRPGLVRRRAAGRPSWRSTPHGRCSTVAGDRARAPARAGRPRGPAVPARARSAAAGRATPTSTSPRADVPHGPGRPAPLAARRRAGRAAVLRRRRRGPADLPRRRLPRPAGSRLWTDERAARRRRRRRLRRSTSSRCAPTRTATSGFTRARPTRARTLPDTVGPGMRLLVCGLNPSLHAADAGVGYVTPGQPVLARGAGRRARDPRPRPAARAARTTASA